MSGGLKRGQVEKRGKMRESTFGKNLGSRLVRRIKHRSQRTWNAGDAGARPRGQVGESERSL